MRLSSIREHLRCDFETTEARHRYADAKKRNPFLQPYGTVFAVIGVLHAREGKDYRLQDTLLRHLVVAMQADIDEPLWKNILLYGFLPTLICIRKATFSDVEDDDLEETLCAVFFETLANYPISSRAGSVAQGVAEDTGKKYRKVLIKMAVERRQYREFLESMKWYEPSELQSLMLRPSVMLNEDERQEIYTFLENARIKRKDFDLLIATEIHQLTIPQYIALHTDPPGLSKAEMQRESDRLWHRRSRAIAKLMKFLEKAQRNESS